MSKRSDKLLLQDILEAASKIETYSDGLSYEEFTRDNKTIDAIVRNFEIIGEATNRLSDGFKSTHDTIEWKSMIGLRNRLVHDYIGIDLFIIWNIIQIDLPILLHTLQELDKNI